MADCTRALPLVLAIALANLGSALCTGRSRAEDARELSSEPAPEAEIAVAGPPGTPDTAVQSATPLTPVAPLTASPGQAAYPESARDEPAPGVIDATVGNGSFLSSTEQRHEGFFLRLTAGAGAGTAQYHEPIDGKRADVTTRGLTGLLELAVGGSVSQHVVLHGNVLLSGFGDAYRTVNGIRDGAQRPTTTMTMLGGGASYYFPINVYLTAAAGVAWSVEAREDKDFSSRTGLGVCFAMGKEWWVGRAGEWGIGAALRAGVTTAAGELGGEHTRVRTGHIGVAVSATLN